MTQRKRKVRKVSESLGEFTEMAPVAAKQPDNIAAYAAARPRVDVGFFKMYDDVPIPEYGTEWSACFDLKAYFGEAIRYVDTWNRLLMHQIRTVSKQAQKELKLGIYLEPGEQALIPTGGILNIPPGFQVQIYPRSGIALKQHFNLGNCVGIVDEDYTKQMMVVLRNNSQERQIVCHGDKIAQAQIVPYWTANLIELREAPEQKTSRAGGFGHTDKVKK